MVESRLQGCVLLTSRTTSLHRRLVYLDNYGGMAMWAKIKSGDMPPHHLRGCLELARMGYEVLLVEPLPDFYFNHRALPHDLRLLKLVRQWLGPDGILFCGHNVLYWLLLLRKCGLLRTHIVSNLWAREPLRFASAHSGIVGLTKAGAEQAKRLAPAVKVAALGWGADLRVYPRYPYRPETFFSCGIALRDFRTVSAAAARSRYQLEVVVPGPLGDVVWPGNVRTIDGGKGWNYTAKRLSYKELLERYYARSACSLIIIHSDPTEYTACGFTELLEVMAMARPVIMTKTGALPSEIDVERAGCGIFVPPGNAEALADAINYVGDNPDVAAQMGCKARQLAETYYNIDRYATDLHKFFEGL